MNSNAQLSDDSQKENTNNGNVTGAGAPHVPPHHNQPLPPPHGTTVQQPDLRKGPGGGQRPPSMVLRQSNAALVAPQPS